MVIRKRLNIILLLIVTALFSGQTLAGRHGHEYLVVKDMDIQLSHQADSDELRQTAEDSADDFREHHLAATHRRPATYLR
ncbi:Protein of uncharacterised function (DUF2554) [Cedecea lapagei]|uniref:Protein of uncharacterized function (DUF2554) n=1 Tax=Cedecea lapagei TaxID=158823 RepID=A0A3S5DPQ3_9ENTR|nr:DUF2554 family protein [Cedecea lapagei]VEB97448.1 Protein of uncharacterised function (DUF2554) [Cedecea lapagei]